MQLADGLQCAPAGLEAVGVSTVRVRVHEGHFHQAERFLSGCVHTHGVGSDAGLTSQVKRMLAEVGGTVKVRDGPRSSRDLAEMSRDETVSAEVHPRLAEIGRVCRGAAEISRDKPRLSPQEVSFGPWINLSCILRRPEPPPTQALHRDAFGAPSDGDVGYGCDRRLLTAQV